MRALDELIAAEQREVNPSDMERARVREKLALRIGGATAVGALVGASATTAAAKVTLSSTALAWSGVFVTVVGVVLGGTWYATRDATPTPAAPAQALAIAAQPPLPPAPTPQAPAPATTPEIAPEIEHPALPSMPSSPKPSAQRPRAEAASAASSAQGLGEDLDRLDAVSRALQQGKPESALELLDAHKSSSGSLDPEFAAARVIALCRAHRYDEAKAWRTRFLATQPSSPLRGRVDQACAQESKSGTR